MGTLTVLRLFGGCDELIPMDVVQYSGGRMDSGETRPRDPSFLTCSHSDLGWGARPLSFVSL